MGTIISTELYKLKRNKSFWGIIIAAIVLEIALFVVAGTENNLGEDLLSNLNMMPFLTVILAVNMAHKDSHEGTLKNLVSCGYSRSAIYFGKLIVTILSIAVLALAITVSTAVYYVVVGGPLAVNVIHLIPSFIIQCILGALFTAIFYVFATVIKNSSFAIIFSYLFYMFGAAIAGVIGGYAHIDGLVDFELTALDTYIMKNGLDSFALTHLVVAIVLVIVFALIGKVIFSKEEIK